MSFLGKFGTSGALDKVLASGDLESTQIQPSLTKLLENKRDVIEKILERLESGPRVQYSVSLNLLSQLLDNTTIDIVMQALPDLQSNIQNDVATLLNTSRSFDPHLLLPYLKEPLSLEISRDMIMAHRREFTAAKLLKAAIRTKPDLWNIIFELVHGRTDAAAFPEAIALSKSKDATLREHATEVIADYSNPAAVDALQNLLKDNDTKVHLAALRGLARIKANLPAAAIFQIMRQMKKDEASLVKALVGNCKDPELIKYLNQAIFGKSTKLRPFAIQALALIANEDNIREVFMELTDRPVDVQNNIIVALAESSGEKFIDAVAELINDPYEKVREIAMEAVELSDPDNLKIIDIMRKNIDNKIPTPIKTSFINKLGAIKDKAAVPSLIKVMRSDAEQRIPALIALEKIADPGALADVFEMLAVDDSDVQCATLSCLSPIIPKKFAGQIREQLLENVDKLKEPAQIELCELVQTITEKHHLPETTAYKNALEKIKLDTSDVIEIDAPAETSIVSEPFGDTDSPFGGSDSPFGGSDNPFGGDEQDGVFGTGEIAIPEKKALPEEDFAIDLVPGEILANRYKLINEIGRGGYGSVWLVEDTFIKDQLVMKFLHQQLISDEIAIERFIRELRLARKVTHTNIIRLFDYLDLGKIAAISMEYFPGAALSSIIHKGIMEPARVIRLAKTISLALESAHQADVVHRDMKPANILVDENDVVKIVDFGIAAASKHAESRLTRTGTLVGTPTYISPEQIQGKVVDGRTDMYSLGIIMYEMLSGQPPYRAEDPMALVFMHVEGNARRLDEVNPVVSKGLADIVHHCIAPEPEKRYKSMAELAEALSQPDLV